MHLHQVAALTLLTLSLATFLGFLWLRRKYRLYCAEMDRIDSLRNAVTENENAVKAILLQFDSSFGEGMAGSISNNVRTKVEFSLSTIDTLVLEDQARESRRLYDMAYETWERVRRNPDDIAYVTAPLNTFCKEIARKKLNIIKHLAREEQS